MSFLLVFNRFQNFDFFWFFGRSENFGGRLRRCACGCQYDVRIPQGSLDLIMMAYIFSPPLVLLGKVVKSQGEVVKSQGRVMKSQWKVVKSQGRVVKSQGKVVKSQGKVVKSQGKVVKRQGKVVKSPVFSLNCIRNHGFS